MWTGDGKTCDGKIHSQISNNFNIILDVNECETNNQCHENATCINRKVRNVGVPGLSILGLLQKTRKERMSPRDFEKRIKT